MYENKKMFLKHLEVSENKQVLKKTKGWLRS